MNNKLLEFKRMMKKQKPKFTRSDSNKKARISKGGWRKPNGLHSKMRLGHFGFKKTVSIGYRMPEEVRGLERDGMKKVVVSNVKDLEKLNPKTDIAVIANVGNKRRVELVNEAQKKKIKISNLKDPAKFLEAVKKDLSERKDKRNKIAERKAGKKKVEAKEKKEEPKAAEEEDKEKQEKMEKDKTIIKRS